MTSHRYRTLEAISELLCYPTESYVQAAELLYVIFQSELPEVAKCIARFGQAIEPRDLHELEENYARTFDINPACALEVGWHLFGEEYARGSLLVRLRNEMRSRGVEESAELPDHLSHVLALVAVMSHDEAQQFVRACVLPAVDKMHHALEAAENDYRHVVRSLLIFLEHEFGRNPSSDDDHATDADTAPRGDPLRDFPMPIGVPESVELVPLRMNYHDSTPREPLASFKHVARPAECDSHTQVQTERPTEGSRNG